MTDGGSEDYLFCPTCEISAPPCCPAHQLQGIQEGQYAQVSKRTGIVAVLDVMTTREDGDSDDAPPVQKRILQVAASTPHVCLAFDPLENERQRQRVAEQVSTLLRPRTRQLFDDISDAGRFPKKKVVPRQQAKKLPPLNLPNEFAYPSGVQSARANSSMTRSEVSSSPGDDVKEAHILVDSAWFTEESVIMAAKAPGSKWQALENADPVLQDAGQRLKSFFPASARGARN
jgi:hypothetical protein